MAAICYNKSANIYVKIHVSHVNGEMFSTCRVFLPQISAGASSGLKCPPVLSWAIIITDTSSAESVAHCKTTCRIWHCLLWFLKKICYLPSFQFRSGSLQFYKLGAQTGTELAPFLFSFCVCVWKRSSCNLKTFAYSWFVFVLNSCINLLFY